MLLQQGLQHYNAWYLIILGLVAIAVTLFARRGLWGTLDEKFSIRLLPTGYYVRLPGDQRGRKRKAASASPAAAEEPADAAKSAATGEKK
jgi:hypothetical protein